MHEEFGDEGLADIGGNEDVMSNILRIKSKLYGAASERRRETRAVEAED